MAIHGSPSASVLPPPFPFSLFPFASSASLRLCDSASLIRSDGEMREGPARHLPRVALVSLLSGKVGTALTSELLALAVLVLVEVSDAYFRIVGILYDPMV